MLIRKENEIEIWTDTIEKGSSKKYFIIAITVTILLLILQLLSSAPYTELFLSAVPISFIIITALITLIREHKKSQLLLKVNIEYIEIFRKNKNKKILMENLNKIDKLLFNYGSILVFFYTENNKECQYNLPVSSANRNLIAIAIKEYKKDLLVSEIINGKIVK